MMIEKRQIMDIIEDVKQFGDDFKTVRSGYTEAFAKAHDLTLDAIVNKQFIPCIFCGSDITGKLFTGKRRGKVPVFCSRECRLAHTKYRFALRINADTNVEQLADELISRGLSITTEAKVRRPKSSDHSSEIIHLLTQILEEIRNATRKA